MGAAPSHVSASHSFSNGTAITVVALSLKEVTAGFEPREKRTLLLSYEVRDRDHPEYLYDFDHEVFELCRVGPGSVLQGLDDVVAWIDDGEWSEEGNEDFPTNFSDVFVRMVIDAINKSWSRTYTIFLTVVIDVEVALFEEPGLEPANEAAVAALEKVFVEGDKTSCAICLEEFPFKAEALSMPCSHAFHQACIVEWLNRRSTCPMCRFRLIVDLSVPN